MTAGITASIPLNRWNYISYCQRCAGGKEAGTYLAGGCTGCENIVRQIAPEHLDKAYQMGLEL